MKVNLIDCIFNVFCASIIFAIYGCVLFEWATWIANKEYDENEKEETNLAIRKREWAISLAMYLAPSAALFCWLMVPLFSQQSLSEESGTCLDQLNISNLHRIRLFLVDQPRCILCHWKI